MSYDSPDAVAALAGLTPVTKASGKHPHPRPSLVRIIYRCWIDHEPYDATKHTAAARLAEQHAPSNAEAA